MKRAAFAIVALCLVGHLYAQVVFTQVVDATATNQNIRFGAPRSSVSIYNCSDGTTPTCAGEEIFYRLYSCNEIQQGASTTITASDAVAIPMALGEQVSYTVNSSSEASLYCAISIICTTAETATVRLQAK